MHTAALRSAEHRFSVPTWQSTGAARAQRHADASGSTCQKHSCSGRQALVGSEIASPRVKPVGPHNDSA